MDRQQLYDSIAARKTKPKDLEPYDGNNGRVNRCVDLFRKGKLRTGEVLVDVGGGIGDLGYAVRDLFKHRLVVDIAEKNRAAAEAKGNIFWNIDVDRSSLSGHLGLQHVDVVVALDFIEHIVDPEEFARECFSLLKPGGQVFINTPNIQFFKHIDELIQGHFPHTSGDREVFHGGHLAFFTFLDLCTIFGGAGFAGFEQIKDEENFVQPPEHWIKTQAIRTQADYVTACMRLGNSNLLFKAVKP